MQRIRVTVALDEDLVERMEYQLEITYYRSRAQIVEEALAAFLDSLEAAQEAEQETE